MQPDVNLFYNNAVNHTAVQVKASGTNVSFLQLTNIASNAVSYIQFFDALSANVTVGTTVSKFVLCVDAAAASHNTTLTIPFTVPLTFKTGLTIAVTTTAGGSSDPSTACPVTLAYS